MTRFFVLTFFSCLALSMHGATTEKQVAQEVRSAEDATRQSAFVVSDALVPLTPPGVKNGASYFTLKNTSDKDRILIGATSSVSDHTEIHEMAMHDGRMIMRKMDELTIPANGEFVFKKGGYHLMLVPLTKTLSAGEKVTLTLTFKNGETFAFDVVVKRDD